jgi:heme A synthase
VSAKAYRGAAAGVALALLVVLLGGLTAKVPGANIACIGFPHCRETAMGGAPLHLQLTHRVLAFLLFFHVIGLFMAMRKRGELGGAPGRAVKVLMALVIAQLLVAAGMVESGLPPVVRSLHQALGVLIWLAMFTLAYLSRIAAAAPAGTQPWGAPPERHDNPAASASRHGGARPREA